MKKMKNVSRRNFLRSIGIASLGVGSVALTSKSARAQSSTRWRMQSWTWPALEQHEVILEWTKRVEVLTGGRLKIEVFPREAVIPHWEGTDAVGRGILEVTMDWPGIWAGRDVGFNIFTPPQLTFAHGWQLEAWFYEQDALKLFREAYAKHNIYIPGVTFWQWESLHSRKPIPNLASLRGMTVRTPPGITSDYFKKLGATPIVLPPPEVFGALDKGMVDAAEFLTPSAHLALGFQRASKYMLWPSIHQPFATIYVAVNKDAWDRLPADIKAIFESSIREFSQKHAYRPLISDYRSLPKYLEAGNVLVKWPKEDWDKARKVSIDLYREYKGKTPLATKAIESLESFLDVLGLLPKT